MDGATLTGMLTPPPAAPPPPPPPSPGSPLLVLTIFLTLANPEATAAPAAAVPSPGPTIGIGARAENADCAPLNVSIVVAAIAAAFPTFDCCPNVPPSFLQKTAVYRISRRPSAAQAAAHTLHTFV